MSWAEPPEFYIDENIVGRTLRQTIEELGYTVHTPAGLFGSRDRASGAEDEVWLAKVAPHGWAVLGRDSKILERPSELAAYRRAGVHMFLFPGQATRAQLIELVRVCLSEIVTVTTQRRPEVLRATVDGLKPMPDARRRSTVERRQ